MNGNALRGKIAERGLTQAKVAEKIGISTNSLSRKLLGKREFTITEASNLCAVLKIENPGAIFFDNVIPKKQQGN